MAKWKLWIYILSLYSMRLLCFDLKYVLFRELCPQNHQNDWESSNDIIQMRVPHLHAPSICGRPAPIQSGFLSRQLARTIGFLWRNCHVCISHYFPPGCDFPHSFVQPNNFFAPPSSVHALCIWASSNLCRKKIRKNQEDLPSFIPATSNVTMCFNSFEWRAQKCGYYRIILSKLW